MYAVIKTGGKQYRVSPGDVLVVEKLAGEPGAKVDFDQVMMLGDGEAVTVGAPLVEGATVAATLIETRKGEKVKIFKKIRRQGYRRTRGHRQLESVLQVTAIAGGGKTATWDGEVNLTPRSELLLRARNLADRAAAELPPGVEVETVVEPEGKGKAARVRARVVEGAEAIAAEPEAAAPEAAPAKPASKKAAAPKKGPNMRDTAKSGAPKQSKAQARAPVRRTSPRGKG
ncbi:MAG TPA: 50S ribosomal protein L21 [Caulobacteraceae bacterium]|jgi:large subunit ribosomal protein L21|nr:50S ribosomal protein L21 [Caulobacteraceae bacterium]